MNSKITNTEEEFSKKGSEPVIKENNMNEKKLLTASERIKLLNQEQKSTGAKII